MSQCASTVSVPHLIPRTVFPLTPSRPPRTVLTVSVYTWDLMNATGRVWDSDTAERVLFPLPFHLSCLELASALGMVFSFLHCRFVLRVTCVLLSGIDLVMACSVLSFLWGGGSHLIFSFGFELLSWRPCSHNCYDSTKGIFVPSCFASRLFRSRWAELNKTISSANVPSTTASSTPMVLLLLFLACWFSYTKRRIFAWFFFGFRFWGALSYFWFQRKYVSWAFLCWAESSDNLPPLLQWCFCSCCQLSIDAMSVSLLAVASWFFLEKKKTSSCLVGFFVASFWPCRYLVYCLGRTSLCVLSHPS